MDRKFVEQMRQSLVKQKKEILESLAVENEEFKELADTMEAKDLVDLAADDIGRKTIEALGAQEMKRLRLIDSALMRIEAERYGQCMKCGKRIPRERLEAIPYALLCIDCKTAEERRER